MQSVLALARDGPTARFKTLGEYEISIAALDLEVCMYIFPELLLFFRYWERLNKTLFRIGSDFPGCPWTR